MSTAPAPGRTGLPKQARTPDEREADIRRKLGRTAAMVRTRILLLNPEVRLRRHAELATYLAALTAWEAGDGHWPSTPAHIFTADRNGRAQR